MQSVIIDTRKDQEYIAIQGKLYGDIMARCKARNRVPQYVVEGVLREYMEKGRVSGEEDSRESVLEKIMNG